MPKPRKGEKESHYVSRFMASDEAEESFPDPKQRAAVAYSMYEHPKERVEKRIKMRYGRER
jgi:hypothetical protein